MASGVKLEQIKAVTFSNGINFPMVGLGTFRTADDKQSLKNAIKYALNVGYRHIDGAWLYGNEDTIGEAVREAIEESNGGLKREDIFYTGKLWNTFHSKENVRKCLNESLSKLGFSYIDLYLIHWPMGFKVILNAENIRIFIVAIKFLLKEDTGEAFPKDSEGNRLYSDISYLETYQVLEELVKEGKVKSIGVSNFNISQLKEVLENSTIKPVNNQIEVSPYLHNDKLVEFCQKNNVVVSAYGPIGAGQKSTNRPDLPILLENPIILNLAKKHGKSPAQICLRWLIQRNIVVLPKSVTPSRLLENTQIFDFQLTDEDMNELKGINQNLRNYGVEM